MNHIVKTELPSFEACTTPESQEASPIRVALLTHYFPTSSEPSAGNSAYQTVRLLAERCDLRVFYPQSSYPGLLKPAYARKKPVDVAWSPQGVDVRYIQFPALPVVTRPLNGHSMAQSLLPHVREFNPDILLNYVIYPDGFAAVKIGQALKIPVVLNAIGSDLNRISDRLCGIFTRYALRHADFVGAVSSDLCRTARTLGADPDRSRALLNGCDTSIFHPEDRDSARESLGIDPNADILLYVGRLDHKKGLVELVEAVSQLSLKRPNLHCYMMGDGPDQALIQQAIARCNAAALVTLIPSSPSSEVAKWMAAANLVTLPSYMEGCPNVIVEALGSGRPVVATNVGGIPELMNRSCGRLVPPRDVPALVRALDETLSEQWSAVAISSMHTRSWADVSDDIYQILRDTLQSRRATRKAGEPVNIEQRHAA